jgi:hypothetical protein
MQNTIIKLHEIAVNKYDYDFYISPNLIRFLHIILNAEQCLVVPLITIIIHGMRQQFHKFLLLVTDV